MADGHKCFSVCVGNRIKDSSVNLDASLFFFSPFAYAIVVVIVVDMCLDVGSSFCYFSTLISVDSFHYVNLSVGFVYAFFLFCHYSLLY